MRRQDVLCLVLGGGRGTRLDPLTRYRSKPAVPVGGKFRLVDIPLSNSLNSGLRRIFVLTQFNSASLNVHIARTYRFDVFGGGFVRIIAAEQTQDDMSWFQGTADAVRRSLVHLRVFEPRDVVILSGDQLYRMDYGPMVRQHRRSGAAVTLAAKPVSAAETSAFGVMRLTGDRRVVGFLEKPKSPDLLAGHELPAELRSANDPDPAFAVSMGIYVFRFDALQDALSRASHIDFGHDVLPAMAAEEDVRAFVFRGYWEDIGTIRAYYEANLGLAGASPRFRFHHHGAPVYTEPRFLAGSRIGNCEIRQAMVCDGCTVDADLVEESVVGIRTVIGRETRLSRSLVMGADIYEGEVGRREGEPLLGIGRGCHIEGAIIDKNVRIGNGVRIAPRPRGTNEDGDGYFVRDGIVVIPKGGVLRDGTVI